MTALRDRLQRALSDSYTLERELGGGGMSSVFVAEERALGRRVVLKVLPEEVAAGVSADRFRREIQLSARLQHPHIVPVHSAGEADGRPFFVMPYIEGESLRTRIQTQGAMPLEEAVVYLKQIASALAYAHKNGIVHRDVKPDNVLLTDGFALVTDFGVAKAIDAAALPGGAETLTRYGVSVGTPSYMAPEQVAADPAIDHRADIYAFGVLAYEMLAGTPPFTGASVHDILVAHMVETPEPLHQRRADLPAGIAAIVMGCLAKRPADRPQTATEILQALGAATSSGAGHSAATGPRRRHTFANVFGSRRATVITAALAVLFTALAATAGYLATRNARAPAEKPTSAAAPATQTSAELGSLAVLPLTNLSGHPDDEYFSEGMTDELANALSKLPGLRVASRTSAYAFKDKRGVDVGEIGRRLRVQAVLEGTVRRAGNRLRVAAQLTSVSDGLSLWSETYERQTSDVFRVQDDIAQSIAAALKPRLGGAANTRMSSARGTSNLEAFDLYLRGRYFWNRRGADNLRKSVEYFDRAIALDPKFGRAYAAQAMAYALLPEYTDSPPRNIDQLTDVAVERALAIDSTLAEAHVAMGLAFVHRWEWDGAERSYRKAIAADPQFPTAYQWYGELLYQTDRTDSAIVMLEKAAELDPLAEIMPSARGYGLTLAGRNAKAIEVLRKGVELSPALGLHRSLLANAYTAAGRHADAVREMEAAVRLDPEVTVRLGTLGYTYGRAGMREKALATVRQLEQKAAAVRVTPVALALAYIGAGQNEKALDALERAVAERDVSLTTSLCLLNDKAYDPLRSSARFASILRRMNLAKFARPGARA